MCFLWFLQKKYRVKNVLFLYALVEQFIFEGMYKYLAPRICFGCLVGREGHFGVDDGDDDDDDDDDDVIPFEGVMSANRTPLTDRNHNQLGSKISKNQDISNHR